VKPIKKYANNSGSVLSSLAHSRIGFLAFPEGLKLWASLYSPLDKFLPIVVRDGITPYGIAWYPLNWPMAFLLNENLYWVWLLAIDAVFSVWLYKSANLIVNVLFQLIDWHWFDIGTWQNVSVTWFGFAAFVYWPLILISVSSKLPLGWSVSLNDPHFQNALHGHQNDLPHFAGYALVALPWAAVIVTKLHSLSCKKR
jgi:hypothetical protein